VAYAADWGFDPEDSTEYIQAAINSGVRTVVIQNMGADWVIKPVKFASNQLVVFEPGVVVAAKPGSFQGPADCLMRGMIVSNVTLWGYGATLRMRREDYIGPDYEHGQWRHCLSFQGSDNVSILGLRCEQSGGDGIYIGAGDGIPATNILIRDCTCDYNYRQGNFSDVGPVRPYRKLRPQQHAGQPSAGRHRPRMQLRRRHPVRHCGQQLRLPEQRRPRLRWVAQESDGGHRAPCVRAV
jgi:hypothetical protein